MLSCQSVFNIRKAKRIYYKKKLDMMAIKIQNRVRKILAINLQNKLKKLKNVIKIQSKWRVILAIKLKNQLKNRMKIIKFIQKWWKNQMIKRRFSATKIQSLMKLIKPKRLIKELRFLKENALRIQFIMRIAYNIIKRREANLDIKANKFMEHLNHKKKTTFYSILRMKSGLSILSRYVCDLNPCE